MAKSSKKSNSTKLAILAAIILAVIAIGGVTFIAMSGGQSSQEHGHSHD